MKHRIERLLHSFGCVVCNPRAMRRRQCFVNQARDAAHIAWAEKLARDARYDRIRTLITDDAAVYGHMNPWQREMLVDVVEARRQGKTVITQMPPITPTIRHTYS